MNIYLEFVAYTWIVLASMFVLFKPLLFGETPRPYSYWGWFIELPFSVGLIIILLKFLGKI